MNQNYLLHDQYASRLYHQYAAALPIVDYHNHLSAAELACDRTFENITQLWITADPYKHRAMRILGVPERYITGDADDYEKFEKWYHCLPRLVGNALFDWSVLEFDQIFQIPLYPFTKTAAQVWAEVNEKLKTMSARTILDLFAITYCAPCTSLLDDLSPFSPSIGLCPSLRGDDIVNLTPAFVHKLEQLTGQSIRTLADLEAALSRRLQDFTDAGCRFTDHALDDGFCYLPDDGNNAARFQAVLKEEPLSASDRAHLCSYLLTYLAGCYSQYGFTMQLHMGARRSTSTRLRDVAGPAGGYAAMGNSVNIGSLITMLNSIEQGPCGLPRILLFPLNPSDNAMISTLSGSFSKDGVEAVISQGPAWWWCDHAQGIRDMLDHLAAFGVLSAFVGMTTDSRSLLSFVRHDYFRRILCSWISEKVTKGTLPDDEAILGDLIRRICYENALNLLQEDENHAL